MPTSRLAYKSGNLFVRNENYSRARGNSLWEDFPALALLQDPTLGVLLNENWQSYNAAASTGDYVLTQATQGTAAISTAESGILELDCNSATQTQGANLQRLKSAFVPVAGTTIWAEFEVKVVDTFDKVELFVGLAESDTTIISSSALSTQNHLGWRCVTNNGVLLFCGAKANTATTKAAATLEEATWIRLGFKVSGVSSVQQYINGVAVGTPLTSTNIPIVALYPSFVCQSGGTNDPILHIRPYRIAQVRDAA